jgi:hypothetical protein
MNMIKQKVCKGKNGKRVGELVAYKDTLNGEECVHIGFALCSNHDDYNKEREAKIALGRAQVCYERVLKVPHSLEPKFMEFVDRCVRYYKINIFPDVAVYDSELGEYVDAYFNTGTQIYECYFVDEDEE